MATDTVPGVEYDEPETPYDFVARELARSAYETPVEPRPVGRRQWLVQREGAFWDRGRIYEFPDRINEGTLGRSPSCQWRITDPSISRLHCALVRKPRRGVYLLDLSSRTGTKLNGDPIQGEVLLMDGDRITLGDRVVLEFVDGPRPEEGSERQWWRRAGWGLGLLALFSVLSLIVF